jgi:hypothetical protein
MGLSNAMKTLVLVMVVMTEGIQIGEENDLFGKSAHCSKCYDYTQMWCRGMCGLWCEWKEGECYEKGDLDEDEEDFEPRQAPQAQREWDAERTQPVAEPQSAPLRCCHGEAKDRCSSCYRFDGSCLCWAQDGTQCGMSSGAGEEGRTVCKAVRKCKLCSQQEVADRIAEKEEYANQMVHACLSRDSEVSKHRGNFDLGKFVEFASQTIEVIAEQHDKDIGDAGVLRAARRSVCEAVSKHGDSVSMH